MIKVIGVRFRRAGKAYYFDPRDLEIRRGDAVIVETARGIEFGNVALPPMEVDEEHVVQPLKPVIRVATEEDIEHEAMNRMKEREAYKICQEKIRKHELEMKLIDAEYTFDNSKVLFYFTADGRVDFRELVKDLAGVFRTRIELRQIGVRDETKMLGGVGICGRVLCCHSYLSDFVPVSIKMAKEQNLSLNPTKISGNCGRLMCCLKNEQETYEYLNSRLPGLGDTVTTPDGETGEVSSVNVLRQTVKVLFTVDRDDKELREYKVDDLKFRPRRRGKFRPEESAPEAASERDENTDEVNETSESAENEAEAETAPNEGGEENGEGGKRENRRNRPRRRDREPRENRENRENGEEGEKPARFERRERRDRRPRPVENNAENNGNAEKNPEGGNDSEGGKNREGRRRGDRHHRGGRDRRNREGEKSTSDPGNAEG